MSTLEHSSSANYSHLEAAERPREEYEPRLGTPFLVPNSAHVDDYYEQPSNDHMKHYRVMFDTGDVAHDEDGREMHRLVGDIELGDRTAQGEVTYILPEKMVYASHLTSEAQKDLALKYGVSYGTLLDTIPDNPKYILDRMNMLHHERIQLSMGQAALNETKVA